MDEQQDLAFRYAIEHGQAPVVRKFDREDVPARVSRFVKRDAGAAGPYADMPKMKKSAASLAELADVAPCIGEHGDRMPIVCCQAADALEQPHPWATECVDSEEFGPGCGETTCLNMSCPKHHNHLPPAEA